MRKDVKIIEKIRKDIREASEAMTEGEQKEREKDGKEKEKEKSSAIKEKESEEKGREKEESSLITEEDSQVDDDKGDKEEHKMLKERESRIFQYIRRLLENRNNITVSRQEILDAQGRIVTYQREGWGAEFIGMATENNRSQAKLIDTDKMNCNHFEKQLKKEIEDLNKQLKDKEKKVRKLKFVSSLGESLQNNPKQWFGLKLYFARKYAEYVRFDANTLKEAPWYQRLWSILMRKMNGKPMLTDNLSGYVGWNNNGEILQIMGLKMIGKDLIHIGHSDFTYALAKELLPCVSHKDGVGGVSCFYNFPDSKIESLLYFEGLTLPEYNAKMRHLTY
ncbi:hypothetical protein AGMMS49949_05440 [Alphaproteobacteria bacterium]|nr:hypothetical protein AGMMS49949_05440 [Alphaproteobacteria bacterium]GHS97618.1 hypothetical protein AGMMS50296_4750 [Alphaproteobacteria bacterium]